MKVGSSARPLEGGMGKLQDLGFRVEGLGFRVKGLGVRV